MQELTIVKIHSGFELYCAMCDTLFNKDMFLENVDYFLDIHRKIHQRMDLNIPDLSTKIDSYGYALVCFQQTYPQVYPQVNLTDNDCH